jgi:hypothetical protein
VLFITHIEPRGPGLERTGSEGGPPGGPPATVFFLSAVEAGRSVASMMATVCPPSGRKRKSRRTNCSLIRRKAATPATVRNSHSIRTSGVRCR